MTGGGWGLRLLLFTALAVGLAPRVHAASCGPRFTGTLGEVARVVEDRVGGRIQVTVHDRIPSRGRGQRVVYATITLRDASESELGAIEFFKLIYDERFDAVADEDIVGTVLNVAPERAHYAEMAHLILDRQPAREAFDVDLARRRLEDRLGGAPTWTEGGRGLEDLVLEVAWRGERVGFGSFRLKGDELRVKYLSIMGNSAHVPGGVQRLGFAGLLISRALDEFPGVARLSVAHMNSDNHDAFVAALAEEKRFREAFLRHPTYRTAARLGFTDIRTIFVIDGGVRNSSGPHFGFAADRP